ncbi:MAG: 23S rRNA (adenine(2503)-C(2))-methyltransferase RlmN [Saprospiraceae bacterium]|nr:23S rRNA (adenine(2503)-C(2))-methyltransferase RlmN [Saprospiraceae bacterium]
MKEQKRDLRKLTSNELTEYFESVGERKFRSKQVSEWLWKKSVTDIDAMSNLSSQTREKLKESFCINNINLDHEQKSEDGTIKSAFRLHDGHLIEGVLIPTQKRMTACISSQVGCSLSCKFCATGFLDRKRNLDASEIYDQVVMINKQALEYYQKPLSNIVYMGMGEPMLNYAEVLKSVEYITSPEGLHMSSQRITISTAGVAKMIRKLADDMVKFNLALSLHAADEEKRNQIMPINETNSLEALRSALTYYHDKTGNDVTFEYILFYNFNDSLKDADNLLKFTRYVPSKVNIIEYNPISESSFTNTDPQTLDKFRDFLTRKGVNVRVRRSRGKDIDAACGQLANKN